MLWVAGRGGQVGGAPTVETHALEDGALTLPIEVIRRRDCIPVLAALLEFFEYHGEPVEIRQGNRLPEQGIGDAEDGCVRANSQRESQSGDQSEARILSQYPPCVSQIL